MLKPFIVTMAIIAAIIAGLVGFPQKQDIPSVQNIAVPAQMAALPDISKRTTDLPPLIERKGNEKVVVELKTKEVLAEIYPGATYEYWTYNGTVPGPFIRVKEGDTVEIRLTHDHSGHQADARQNAQDSIAVDAFPFVNTASAHGDEGMSAPASGSAPMGDMHMPAPSGASADAGGHDKHSIDLHAVEGPGGGSTLTQASASETKVFQFTATRPGIYVYHCASAHIPTHIANGMYGLILVEPKQGLSKVDREFYVMQSEFYTSGKFGEQGHQLFSRKKLDAESPEYFVFNGRTGALTGDNALEANVGETIRIFFGVGSHIAANFHIIGAIMDRLYPEGDILSPPHRNVQTTIVPPGGAMMTEFKLEAPGKYLLVDHSLTRAIDKGAVAELLVKGEEKPDIIKPVE